MYLSEKCYNDILDLVEMYIDESSRARKYGQKNTDKNSRAVDIYGTKALKDSAQMNYERKAMNHPETQRALKNKEALQTAIKALEKTEGVYGVPTQASKLKDAAREISRRRSPEENEDILNHNGDGHLVKSGAFWVRRFLEDNNGYRNSGINKK